MGQGPRLRSGSRRNQQAVLAAFNAEGIPHPYPQRVVQVIQNAAKSNASLRLERRKTGDRAPVFSFSVLLKEHLVLTQVAPLPSGGFLGRMRPMRTRLSPTTRKPTSSHIHFLGSTLATFAEHGPQLIVVQPLHQRRPQRRAVERQPVIEQRQPCRSTPRDAHQIFLLDIGILADQLAGNAPILREHEQARRVDIQPPGRRQPTSDTPDETREYRGWHVDFRAESS